jgi:hypothetical protein
MTRARAFVYHPWRLTTDNLTAWCDTGYYSEYVLGDYMGLPYDWGGFVSLLDFDLHIADGYGAGSYPSDGVLSCTTGLDCSGFVSQAWNTATKYGTSTLPDISTVIDVAEVLAGDVFNTSGYHVILYSHELANGDPVFFETVGYHTQINTTGGWSYVSGYTPRRYDQIEGSTATTPPGVRANPIAITSFPYADSGDTTDAVSNVLDGCALVPETDESGPEYIYTVTFSEPGTLTVSVSDDVVTDIDVHLYGSMNANDCLARDDTTFTHPVDCGTYLIVADTYVDENGTALAGTYDLTVDFSPSGQPCGTPPVDYDFEGELGDPCAYPGDQDLPFCNPNLGADTCLYTSDDSFCSRPCQSAADCSELSGACCQDIGTGELYCMPAGYCETPTPDGGVADSAVADGGTANPDGETDPDGQTQTPDGNGAGPDAMNAPDGSSAGNGGDNAGCGCRTLGAHFANRSAKRWAIFYRRTPVALIFLVFLLVMGVVRNRGRR